MPKWFPNGALGVQHRAMGAKAAQDGQLDFLFDGKVYPSGMTKEKVKKMEDDRKKASEKANPQLNK